MPKYIFLLFIIFFSRPNSTQAQEIIQIDQGEVYDFRFSPHGSMAYIASGKSVHIWDIQKKTQIGFLENGPGNTIISLDVTNDSSFLVASSLDSVIAIWNLSDFTLLTQTKINSIANSVSFCNNGSSIVAGLRNGVLLSINSFTGEVIMKKETGLEEVTSLALSDSMGYLAASGPNGIVQLWNLYSFTEYEQKKIHSNFVRGLVFSKDGKYLYSCGDDGKVFYSIVKMNKLEKDYNILSDLSKSWITTLDVMYPQSVAYANFRGKVTVKSFNWKYSYHFPNQIFKLHFLPHKSPYIALGLATNDGLKIIWAKKMKMHVFE